MCLGVYLCKFILLGVDWTSLICRLKIFIKFGDFKPFFIQIFFLLLCVSSVSSSLSLPLSPPSLSFPPLHIHWYNFWCSTNLKVLFIFFSCSSDWLISISLSLFPDFFPLPNQICCSAPLVKFYFSYSIFNFRISIWLFLIISISLLIFSS